MAIPFASKWEVTSLRWNHGSFVEAAQVRPLSAMATGDFWVERPVADLKPAHLARLRRRWWLASQLTSPAWPTLIDAGEDGGAPWAVIESPGRRMDGTYPFTEPRLALNAVRGLAFAAAEAEAVLAAHCTSPHLSIRASSLGRDESGRLRFHLATLDPEVDHGIPATSTTWMWTAEELLGQPETSRSNVFALAWLATLMLTGRSPWGAATEGHSEKQRRDALLPLITQARFQLALPDGAKAVEPVLKRALSPNPGQRYASAAAFAEALAPHAPGAAPSRPPSPQQLDAPEQDSRFEWVSPSLDAKLMNAPDDAPVWDELASLLAPVHPLRARLLQGDDAPRAQLTPALGTEKLECGWRRGYVRTLTVSPGPERRPADAHVLAITALLQHPSLRFLHELVLAGPLDHARVWHDALQRTAPASLRRITTHALTASDPLAVDLAFRFPRWTWVWGTGSAGGNGLFRRLFGG